MMSTVRIVTSTRQPSTEERVAKEKAFLEVVQRVFANPPEHPSFLFSYKNFITPGLNLFNIWAQEFERSRGDPQRTRLLEFLHCWMSQYPTDLSSPEHKRILSLLSNLEAKDEQLISEFKRLISLQNTTTLKRLISRQSASTTEESRTLSSSSPSPPSSPLNSATSSPKTLRSIGTMRNWLNRSLKGSSGGDITASCGNTSKEGRDLGKGRPLGSGELFRDPSAPTTEGPFSGIYESDFLSMSALDIARELTAIEFEIFRNINPRELLNQCWQKVNRNTTAPNITKLIAKFNEVSYWVATEILTRSDPREQARIICKFIKIARLCYQLYNFNSLSEILTGLNNSAVIRLKLAWLCVPDRYMRHFQQLDQLMQPQSNYLHYRQEIRRLTFTKKEKRPINSSSTSNPSLPAVTSDSSLPLVLSMDDLSTVKSNDSASISSSITTSTSTSSLPSPKNKPASQSPSKTPRIAALSLDDNLPPMPQSPGSQRMQRTRPLSTGPMDQMDLHKAEEETAPKAGAAQQHQTFSPFVKKAFALSGARMSSERSVGEEGETISENRKRSKSERDYSLGFPRSPRSPRAQWAWEIGANRDRNKAEREKSDGALSRSAASNAASVTKSNSADRLKSDDREKPAAPEGSPPVRMLSALGSSSSSASGSIITGSGSPSLSSSGASIGGSQHFQSRGVPPILPYLAIILRDFNAVTEGNAPYHPDGRINYHLIELQYQIIDEMKNFQANSYSLPRKKEIRRYLENLNYQDDDDLLYSLSLKSCPINQPLASELEGMASGESILNPDKAQEYFEETLRNTMTDVTAVLSKKEDHQVQTNMIVTDSSSPFPTRERNASLAFYTMLSQGTAGMLEREMLLWRRGGREGVDASHPRSQLGAYSENQEDLSDGDDSLEETIQSTYCEVSSSEAEETHSASNSPNTSLLNTPPTMRASFRNPPLRPRTYTGKERPKSLQPFAGLTPESLDLHLRDRSNSASTVDKKQHFEDEDKRPKQNKKAKKAKKAGKANSTGTLDEVSLLSSLRDVMKSSSDDTEVGEASSEQSPARPRKSLKALKERILSFRGKVEIAKDDDSSDNALTTSGSVLPRKAQSNTTSPTNSSSSLGSSPSASRSGSVDLAASGVKEVRSRASTASRESLIEAAASAAESAAAEATAAPPPSPASVNPVIPSTRSSSTVMTRERQGSIAFYAALSHGAAIMLQEEGILSKSTT